MANPEIIQVLAVQSRGEYVEIPVLDILQDHPWELPGTRERDYVVSQNDEV